MKRIKIIAVCGFGVGTSLILKMNIESAFKAKGFNVDVDYMDVTTAKGTLCDIMFTSSELYSQLKGEKVPIVIVDNFMDKNEILEKGLKALGL
jgi:ascorbate PTS system EIIB component